MQQKLSVTDSEVQAGRQEISKATDTAQQTYTDVAAKMASSTKVICVSANKTKNPKIQGSLLIAANAANALQSNLIHA